MAVQAWNKAQPTDPKYLKLAFADLGMKEIPGRKHNSKIVQTYADVGHAWVKDDETPWCAAWLGSKLKKGGLPNTGQLTARSYLNWGKATRTPKRGDVVVFKRGNSSWQGHVAFFLKREGSWIYVLGGNQSNAVTIARYSAASVLGFRTPLKLNPVTGNSNTTKGAAVVGTGTAVAVGADVVEQHTTAPTDVAGTLTETGQTLSWYADPGTWLGIFALALIIGGTAWMLSERLGWWKKKGF